MIDNMTDAEIREMNYHLELQAENRGCTEFQVAIVDGKLVTRKIEQPEDFRS